MMARRYLSGRRSVGEKLKLMQTEEPFEIIGVVKDTKFFHIREHPEPIVYVFHGQFDRWAFGAMLAPSMTLLIRSLDEEPLTLAGAVRKEIRSMDPALAVFGVTTLRRRLAAAAGAERQAAILSTVFAFIVLGLSLAGLYGVLTQTLVRRAREIGIRIACGAGPTEVRRLILIRGFLVSLLGVTLGVILALWFSDWIGSRLYGVTPTDGLVYSLSALFLMVLTLLISYLPARRAVQLDPAFLLRTQG